MTTRAMALKLMTSHSQERVYVLVCQKSICAGGALWSLHLGDLLLKMMRVDGIACSCEPVNRFECSFMLFPPPASLPSLLFPLIDNAMKEAPTGPDAPF